MSRSSSAHEPVDAETFWSQLVDLEDGTISPDDRDELMELLDRSEAARRLYSEYFLHSEGLAAEARFLEEQGRLPVSGDDARPSRLFFRSLVAAAAVLLIGGIIASVVMLQKPTPRLLSAAATAGAQWSVDGQNRDPATSELTVAAGDTVHVASGTLKLHFELGPKLVLQGPARVSFPELNRPVLYHGWLWIDSDRSGESFEVQTPELLVREIGTRFGVRVPAQGPAEVHLNEGKVEVIARDSQTLLTILEPTERGFRIPPLDQAMSIPLASDPFTDLEELLAKQANYSTTIHSQNPTQYWRLEESRSDQFANEIPNGTTGGRALRTRIAPSQLTMADGFPGFSQDNHAALLSGDAQGIPLSLGVTPIHRGTLFHENFNGREAVLNGQRPEVSVAHTKWIASPSFRRNGSISGQSGSATLGFSPLDGCRYLLEATFTDLDSKDNHWIALGFANGQSSESGWHNRFIDGNPEGRAWMLVRGSNLNDPNMAHTRGTGDAVPWSGSTSHANGGTLDLRIVLDTTDGPGRWTATWYARRPEQNDFTCVRSTSPLVSEMISSVGLAISGGDLSGHITRFSLQAESSLDETSQNHLAKGPARLPRREGAVTFWVRHPEEATERETLWVAGDNPTDRSMQATLEADGRIAFFMENGRYDVLITSRPKIDDGRWHHLAMTWSPGSVDLYLDGNRVARDSEGRSIQQGILTELRFGCGPQGSSKNAPFSGQLDEIAVWDRPLTAVEVHHQFQSAAGP